MVMAMSSSSAMSMTSSTSAAMASSTASTTSGMASMMTMVPYLHFTGGDSLFFKTLAPSSHGAIAGACIVLCAIAVFERWFSSVRGYLALHWRRRALAITSNKVTVSIEPVAPTPTKEQASDIEEVNADDPSKYAGFATPSQHSPRIIEPFILSHDIPRGVLYAVQAFLAYTLMLAVMTFQAAYIISIIIGLGLGEILFGRAGTGDSRHLLH